MKKIVLLVALSISFITLNAQTELTDENAEAKLLVNNDKLIVLDFYATWCGPCKRMAPIMKELESEYPNVDFYQIDVDKNQTDDALGISAMPTYLFIKNSSNLEQIEGAMTKAKMKSLIDKHLNGNTDETEEDIPSDTFDVNDYSQKSIDNIWNSSSKLNSMAWNAYKNHDDIQILLKSIKIVERSIELEKNYYNVDTHAALLYKTGRYKDALKKGKEAIEIAKKDGLSYSTTSDLIDDIIDKL
ncbi:MAG: thiol reductase thioredoxin [Winogradskyella sp.]|nr:MAG: thiol reductase thioredoxin [Winogradskyella sp.]